MYLRVIRSATMALFLHATFNTAAAQEQVTSATALPAPTTALAPPVIDFTTIPAGTPVAIEIAEALASSTHKRGDVFAITLIEPLLRDGVEYLPQGTHGTGQIVHAAPARGGGAPGELLIAARTLETSQGHCCCVASSWARPAMTTAAWRWVSLWLQVRSPCS